MTELTKTQLGAVGANETSFLLGPAGTGKTTALQHRLLRLLADGEPAYTILTLLAEEDHRQEFLDFLHRHDVGPYADLRVTTYTYLARAMVDLFWPLVARPAGFERPYQPPTFLRYDLAQLLMWRIVTPMMDAGAFADLRLRPQQIVSQLIDTLNRAALNGLTLEEASRRQIATWAGEGTRQEDELRHLREAATAAKRFRTHCRRHSLLDLSLTVQVFDTQLVRHPEFHRYFEERFRYLLIDNIEEQTPAGQNFVATLIDKTQSTAIAYDAGGGYKRFLSADPEGAEDLRDRCEHVFLFYEEDSFTSTEPLQHLANQVHNYLRTGEPKRPAGRAGEAIISVIQPRYRREMILDLIPELSHLIRVEEIAPEEMAIIVPYLDGALRYTLEQALQEWEIPYTLLRRRSSPRDEPRVRAWLTWLALAHPQWEMAPVPYDVAEAFTLSIAGLDPARAQLLTDALYREEMPGLLPIAEVSERVEDRVGRDVLTMVEDLRHWLADNGSRHPVDVFLHRLFNELLARPPFRPEADVAGAAVCDWLVRTAGRLRDAAGEIGLFDETELGRAFITGINQGLVTADPPQLGEPPDPNGVLIATMYGYLLTGRATRVQVWLETAATGWWDIPRQPLSNVFVLAQSWDPTRKWTMAEDYRIRNELLSRIVRGLAARCSDGVILANSDLDRRGQRQDGPLWRALQPVIHPRPGA